MEDWLGDGSGSGSENAWYFGCWSDIPTVTGMFYDISFVLWTSFVGGRIPLPDKLGMLCVYGSGKSGCCFWGGKVEKNPITDQQLLQKKKNGACIWVALVGCLILVVHDIRWKWIITLSVLFEVLTFLPVIKNTKEDFRMWDTKKRKKEIAEKIVEIAERIAGDTVNKSIAFHAYERDVPDSVKEYIKAANKK